MKLMIFIYVYFIFLLDKAIIVFSERVEAPSILFHSRSRREGNGGRIREGRRGVGTLIARRTSRKLSVSSSRRWHSLTGEIIGKGALRVTSGRATPCTRESIRTRPMQRALDDEWNSTIRGLLLFSVFPMFVRHSSLRERIFQILALRWLSPRRLTIADTTFLCKRVCSDRSLRSLRRGKNKLTLALFTNR